MSGHTPGPWKERAGFIYSHGPNSANICALSVPRASTTLGYAPIGIESCNDPEVIANGDLIAAAPNMLKALNRVLGLLIVDSDPAALVSMDGTEESAVIEVYEIVSAAIAEATASLSRQPLGDGGEG